MKMSISLLVLGGMVFHPLYSFGAQHCKKVHTAQKETPKKSMYQTPGRKDAMGLCFWKGVALSNGRKAFTEAVVSRSRAAEFLDCTSHSQNS
ncbi:hypothetical protein BDR22DRAFT_865086 [Usnea florida]